MISIISVCYDRQEMIDKILPLWLSQKGVDIEILLAVGPDIKRITDHRVTYYPAPNGWDSLKGVNKICESFNLLWPKAKGEQIFITYCDMAMPNPHHLSIMLKAWHPGLLVTHSLGDTDCGIWTHGMLADKLLIYKSGGWDNYYDHGYAFEDSDFVSGLLQVGAKFHILKQRVDGLQHIDHPRAPDNADRNKRYYHNKCRYHSKHAVTIMEMLEQGKFPQHDE